MDRLLIATGRTPNTQALALETAGIAVDADGDMVIVWSSYSQTDGNQLGTGYDLYARRFTSAGTAVTSAGCMLPTLTAPARTADWS